MDRIATTMTLFAAEKAVATLRAIFPDREIHAVSEELTGAALAPSTGDVERYGTAWAANREPSSSRGVVMMDLNGLPNWLADNLRDCVNIRGDVETNRVPNVGV